jgi:acyl-CoA synthetase (AMP-forming)/AMP-acid ligase II
MWLHHDIQTLADIPRHYARTATEKPALIDAAGTFSFGQLDQSSNRIANAILARKIAPRSHVGFLGKNSAWYFETLFGANKAGCALTPLNWRLSVAELVPVVEDAQSPLIFVDAEFAELAKAIQGRCRHPVEFVCLNPLDRSSAERAAFFAGASDQDPRIDIAASDTALLIYTSGTTGKPKGVQLTHGGLHYMRLCEHLEPALKWHPDDVMLMVMPNFHLVGTGLTVQALYNGCPTSILPALDPGKLLKLVREDRPTICALVPTAIQMILDHPDAKNTDFSSLRLVMYAGSAISSHLLQRALKEMKCQFMQFYGATESSGAMTLLRPEQHDANDERKLRSCGTPLPLIEIRIVDGEGQELPRGEPGEFQVRSPSLFSGYWNQPETTADAVRDGWYRTGDAGFQDADGLFYIVDRVKDMIVTGGENVYSAEVEQVLAKFPGVNQCAVIGAPDERWGEKVTALLIMAEGRSSTAEEVIAHCRGLIAGYKVPKEIHFVESLPMTATGKVLKRVVRDRFWKDQARTIG